MPLADDLSPVLRLGRGPLVGRARELAVLADALAEADARHPSVVLLAGEPGIGKTRLLDEFPPPELADGVRVLLGGASEAEGMPPYVPFIEVLEAYLASADMEALREDVGANAGFLARLLPAIERRLGSVAAPADIAPEQARLRLYEAVAALLRGIAARDTLVLALDDLQWADAATCDLLVHVVRRLRSERLLVVGAYRAGEAEGNSSFMRARTELNRLRLLRELPLRRLNSEESRLVAAGLLGDQLAPAVGDLLHRQGEGNPFFEEELLRALVEQRHLAWRAGRWELRGTPDRLLPSSLTDIVRLRVGRLEPAVGDVLRVAALVGRSFDVDLLATVLRIGPDEVEQHLSGRRERTSSDRSRTGASPLRTTRCARRWVAISAARSVVDCTGPSARRSKCRTSPCRGCRGGWPIAPSTSWRPGTRCAASPTPWRPPSRPCEPTPRRKRPAIIAPRSICWSTLAMTVGGSPRCSGSARRRCWPAISSRRPRATRRPWPRPRTPATWPRPRGPGTAWNWCGGGRSCSRRPRRRSSGRCT